MKVKSESEVTQSCLTLSVPMDCSLPGSSVHRIFQARVLERGAIAFSAFKQQEETNDKSQIFPLLYTKLRGVSFKILCCHDDTWFHLSLTFLKPWANQCVFLMEMFFLSYVNELCIYPRFFLQVAHQRLRTDLTNQYVLLNKPVCFTHANILSYVNETMYLLGNLLFKEVSRFKIQVNRFMAWDDLLCANVISKCMLWVRDLVPLSEFWDISFL